MVNLSVADTERGGAAMASDVEQIDITAALAAFVSPPDFYPEAGRSELLTEALHYVQFSAVPIQLQCSDSVEQACFVHQLITELRPTSRICYLEPDEDATKEGLLLCVAQELGINVLLGGDVEQLLKDVTEALRSDHVYPLTTLVCNLREGVSSGLIEPLVELVALDAERGLEAGHLRLLVAGMDDAAVLQSVSPHALNLPLLSEPEARAYLAWCLQGAGVDVAHVFTLEQENLIVRQAAGHLGRIRDLARKMLEFSLGAAESEGAQALASPSIWPTWGLLKFRGIPWLHVTFLSALLAALLLSFFYGGDEGEPSVVARSSPVREPLPATSVTLKVAEPVSAKGESAKQEPSLVIVEPAPIEEPGVPVTPSVKPSLEAPAAAEVKSEVVLAKPAEVAVVAGGVRQERLSASERYLLSLPGSHFVLQVMASGSRASVEQFIAQQSNKKALVWYEVVRSGKPWFVVVTGNYASVERARADIASLPSAQRKAGPWPRSLSVVQGEIEGFRSK